MQLAAPSRALRTWWRWHQASGKIQTEGETHFMWAKGLCILTNHTV